MGLAGDIQLAQKLGAQLAERRRWKKGADLILAPPAIRQS